jgi:hypothetical protein
MKQLVILAIMAMVAGCATRGDPRLSGTFISDKAATLAYLESTGAYEPAKLAKLGDLFGKLEVTYDGPCVTVVLDGFTQTDPFRIADSGPDHVSIETGLGPEEFLGGEVLITNRLDFTGDGYWLSGGALEPPFKEKFRKK